MELQRSSKKLREGWQQVANRPQVTADIAEVVAMWTGIPVHRMAGEERERLLEMEQQLHKRIIGQEEPDQSHQQSGAPCSLSTKDPRCPIGTFIFWPTGAARQSESRRWPNSSSAAKKR
ncbi:MAG: hypothetical protein R2856_05500 [Caldilineaceae bacterium]